MKNDKKNFIWNTIGLTANAFNSLFFLIAVRFFNGVEIAGTFSYSFSLCALLYVVAMFYTRAYQIANYNNSKKISDFFTFRLMACILCFIVGIGFCILNSFNTFTIIVILLILLFRIIEAVSDCFYGYIQEKEELYKVGFSLFIKAVLGLASFCAVNYLTHDLMFSLIAIIVANALVFIAYDLPVFNKLKKQEKVSLNFKKVPLIFSESITIFLFTFLLIYMANIQKYVLVYNSTETLQMIFGILIMPSTMLSLIGNYLIMPFMTRLTKNIKEKNFISFGKATHKILLAMVLIGAVGLIFTYFLGIPLLSFVYQYDLSPYKMELLIIVFASIISATAIMISNYLVLLNKNKVQLIFYSVAAIITTFTSVILIQSQGLMGAALAYLIGYIVLMVFYAIYYEYILRRMK